METAIEINLGNRWVNVKSACIIIQNSRILPEIDNSSCNHNLKTNKTIINVSILNGQKSL